MRPTVARLLKFSGGFGLVEMRREKDVDWWEVRSEVIGLGGAEATIT